MLRTRLWMGSILIGLGVMLLLEDRWYAPWYPIFAVAFLAATLLGVREYLSLIPADQRPDAWLTTSVALILACANWLPNIPSGVDVPVWSLLAGVLIAGTILAFLWEMYHYDQPGNITQRLGLTIFAWVYLGSPKKTWQGFVGGMLAAIGVTYGIEAIIPLFGKEINPYHYIVTADGRTVGFRGAYMEAFPPGPLFVSHFHRICFALTVGVAGVLGDLAESLIKRDLQTKDASQTVPGFGGVLDVIDSLLFGAPVVWLWFCFR